MSPISSKNNVPPSACSKRPLRNACAPVKEPFSWPNNSDSNNSFGIAAVFKAMKALSERGLCLCSERATSSLPVPDSPVIKTLITDFDSRPIVRNTSCIAGAAPIISGLSLSFMRLPVDVCFLLQARCAISTASSISKGFGKYSNAPP